MPQVRFTNGHVFTGSDETDFVDAFTVTDGSVSRVGATDDDRSANTVDLGGRTVVPAFLDIHTHPPGIAMTVRAVPCIAPAVTNIPQMIDALKKPARAGQGDDAWIEGWGYDESKLAEHR